MYAPKMHSNQSINCLSMEEKKVGIKKLRNPKAFIDYSHTNDDVYENLEEYNPIKEQKILIVFDDMIVDKDANRKLNHVVTESSLRGRELNILFIFISQSYFKLPKTRRLNVTNCFIMEKTNKMELQEKASNHSFDTEFKDFMKLGKDYTKEPFLVNDTTLLSDKPLGFTKNLL